MKKLIPHTLLRRLTPLQLLVFSFAGLILIGTLLLWLLPGTSRVELSFIDSLFTITSAVCVTGLIVLDTGSDFTGRGQLIIFLCFQFGGLGIMTFSSVIIHLIGRKVSFRGRTALQESIAGRRPDIGSLVWRVFKYTVLLELFGAALLWAGFSKDGSLFDQVANAVFHSVSAFCNAGFSLYRDSLIGYRGNALVSLTICLLIICGGLGFVTLEELSAYFKNHIVARNKFRLSLHTKIVLISSFVLLLIGFIGFLTLGHDALPASASVSEKLLAATFASVTARTAGFNTVDYGLLSNGFLMLTIILMIVGGSPGSTAGGIKTTTAATLLILFFRRLKGKKSVYVFSRTLPDETVAKAVATATAFLFVLLIFTLLLTITELGNTPHMESRGMFLELLFEAASALGTVGLSTGATAKLSVAGKAIVVTLMFCGRLGPLSIALAAGMRESGSHYKFAEEDIQVG